MKEVINYGAITAGSKEGSKEAEEQEEITPAMRETTREQDAPFVVFRDLIRDVRFDGY
jgi:hypothetical protein